MCVCDHMRCKLLCSFLDPLLQPLAVSPQSRLTHSSSLSFPFKGAGSHCGRCLARLCMLIILTDLQEAHTRDGSKQSQAQPPDVSPQTLISSPFVAAQLQHNPRKPLKCCVRLSFAEVSYLTPVDNIEDIVHVVCFLGAMLQAARQPHASQQQTHSACRTYVLSQDNPPQSDPALVCADIFVNMTRPDRT